MDSLLPAATFISGIAWIIAYLDIANRGFRDKTYGMPLFPLALNFTWELFVGFGYDTGNLLNRDLARVCFVLDAVIVYTYFRYGRKTFDLAHQPLFLPWGMAAFAASIVLLWGTFSALGPTLGMAYSAWAIAVLISVSFIGMLNRRRSVEGQSMIIAVAKCIASLAPALALWRMGLAAWMPGFGAVVFLYDATYIVMLYIQFRRQGLDAWTRRPRPMSPATAIPAQIGPPVG